MVTGSCRFLSVPEGSRATRAGQHAADFLAGWKDALMADDYGGYKALFSGSVTELACWAHARRKFVDVHQADGSPLAREAVERIGVLYAIEATLRDRDTTARYRARQRLLVPRLDELKRWLDALQPNVLGNTGLGKAVNYTLKRWNALARVAGDGRYPIDNNTIGNAIGPIAIGRKN